MGWWLSLPVTEILPLLSTLAAFLAAGASWKTVRHLTQASRYTQASGAYGRIVREPILAACTKHERSANALLSDPVNTASLGREYRQVAHEYQAAVRPLRAVRVFDLSELVGKLEALLEKCEDDLTNLLSQADDLGPLTLVKANRLLHGHSTELKDLLERYDPGRRKPFPKLQSVTTKERLLDTGADED